MAITNVSFSAQVDDWVKQTQDRMERVFKASVQEVVNEMTTSEGHGGAMPVDTGFLRASVVATTGEPTPINPLAKPEKGKTYVPDGSVDLVIAGLDIGQTVHATFTAAYALRMEYGFTGTDSLGREYNQSGRGFVRLAAQRWEVIVEANAQRAREAALGAP